MSFKSQDFQPPTPLLSYTDPAFVLIRMPYSEFPPQDPTSRFHNGRRCNTVTTLQHPHRLCINVLISAFLHQRRDAGTKLLVVHAQLLVSGNNGIGM